MHNGPLVVAWNIGCPNAAAAAAIQETLRREADLNAVRKVAFTGGGETSETPHRLGEYFQAIRVEPGPVDTPHALRLIFHRRPDAGRYWRDLMMRVLQSVTQAAPGVSVALSYRLEESSSAEPPVPRAVAG